MKEKIYIGIDGGGTYTRVVVTDAQGHLLSRIKWPAGASIRKNTNACADVQKAIKHAVSESGYSLSDVAALGLGVANFESEKDLSWVENLTAIDELTCIKKHVNDAVIAHMGALLGQNGIIAIAGTGSVAFAITEKGRHIRNYDFNHYADVGARHLVFSYVYQLLAGYDTSADAETKDALLKHFHVSNIYELALLGADGFAESYQEMCKLFGDFAPTITDAAAKGYPLAVSVCDRAAFEIATEIRLLGACFATDSIHAALIGSVANCEYIKSKVLENLDMTRFIVMEPALSPEYGAIILAMQAGGLELNNSIIENLMSNNRSIYCKHHTINALE